MQIDEAEIARRVFILVGALGREEVPDAPCIELVKIAIEDLVSPSRVAVHIARAYGKSPTTAAAWFEAAGRLRQMRTE